MGEATGRRWGWFKVQKANGRVQGRLPTQAHWGCVGAPDKAGPLCTTEDARTWAPHLSETLCPPGAAR